MRIGLTYDLKREYLEMGFSEEETAEFDSDETIYYLKEALGSLGYEVVRIGNIYELTKHLNNGERWDLVFNICEGLYGRSREAQVPALLEAYNIPYTFSDPLTLSLSLDKAMAKRIVRDAGVPTPEFFSITSVKDLEEKNLGRDINFPLFVKPALEGTGKGISTDSIVWDKDELKKQCMKLLIKYRQPVLVERYLPGKEFTAGIVGTGEDAQVIGIMEVKFLKNAEASIYSYNNKKFYEDRVDYALEKNKKLINEISKIALSSYRVLGCRDAGRVDLKADKDDRLYFIEINPLAGLHPVHSDLPIICSKVGITYRELISEIVKSAWERKGKSVHCLSLL